MNWTWKTRESTERPALPEDEWSVGAAAQVEETGREWSESPENAGEMLLPEPPPGSRYALGSLVLRLEIDKIVPNPAQPRKYFAEEAIASLADSIRRHGVLQPLTVRAAKNGRFELVAGERRLRAARLAGLSRVPCLLVDTDDTTSAELAVVENLQREDLNMFEEAEAIGKLGALYGLTQEQIAERLSCSQSAVANKLRLLKLSPEHRAMILSAGLSERHARALLRLRDEEMRDEALRAIIGRRLNVAASEELIEKLLTGDKPAPVRKMILRDVRVFYHSIDRAVDLVRRAGVPIETERTRIGNCVEILLRVPDGDGEENARGTLQSPP